jgi:hypothetical protein
MGVVLLLPGKEKAMRWSWKAWQAFVQEKVTDADARELARVWPAFAKMQGGKRGMWAQEMMYTNAPLAHWEPLPGDATAMSRIMRAANRLQDVGLASRCPGTPLYVPEYPVSIATSEEEENHV